MQILKLDHPSFILFWFLVLMCFGYMPTHAQNETDELRRLQMELTRLPEIPALRLNASGPRTALMEAPELNLDFPRSERILLKSVEMRGDIEFLEGVGLRDDLEFDLTSEPYTESQIDQLLTEYNGLLVSNGYYMALIDIHQLTEDNHLILNVDQGRIGNLKFFRLPKDFEETTPDQRKELRKPYRGHFSILQLRDRMTGNLEEEIFDFDALYQNLFRINSLADIVIHSDLLTRINEKREVDLDLYIEDRMPLHLTSEIKNTGTENTDDYRVAFKLQHLNLTKRYDALAISLPMSLDLETIRSASASYILPLEWGGVSLFGGYSELSVDDVVDGLNVNGDGWFTGPRMFYNLVRNENEVINAVAGGLFRSFSDSIDSEGEILESSSVDELQLSLGLTYQSVRPDIYRARHFFSSLLSYNLGYDLGISDRESMEEQRVGADPGFWTTQLTYSRIASLFGTPDPLTGLGIGDWYWYNAIDLQYTPDTLVPGDQKALGGFETVRGYVERAIAGDSAIYSRNELRTTIYRGFLTKLRDRKATFEERQNRPPDYVQALVFADAGYIENNTSIEDGYSDLTLLSVGIGGRVAIGGFSQLKVDYGFPLISVDQSDTDKGRLHFALEAQF